MSFSGLSVSNVYFSSLSLPFHIEQPGQHGGQHGLFGEVTAVQNGLVLP